MKMIRHLSAVLLATLGMVLVAACDNRQPQSQPSSQQSSQQQTSSQQTQTANNSPAPPAIPAKLVVLGIGGEVSAEKAPPGAKADSSANFLFVIDGSGSMNRDLPSADQRELATVAPKGRKLSTRLDGAKWAVEQALPNVPDEANLGLIVFDTRGLREVIPLGKNNRKEFLSAVQGIQADGGTPLKDALIMGANKLVEQYPKQLGYGEYRLICVTDGEADGGASDCQAAGNHLSKYNVPLYTIGFQLGGPHGLQPYSVWYKNASSSRELSQGLKETMAEVDTDAPPQPKNGR